MVNFGFKKYDKNAKIAILSNPLSPMSISPPSAVLFVCLGNICRSPSAEAVMTHIAKNSGLNTRFDSAGTASYHIGNTPDLRAIQIGKNLGYDLSTLRARQVNQQDFYDFDIIFAMDKSNLTNLHKIMPKDATANVMMFDNVAVDDPYYGNMDDFKVMFEHIQSVSNFWLNQWQQSKNHD